MEAYVFVPFWVVGWLLLLVFAEVVLRLQKREGLRTLYFHLRVWQLSLTLLAGFAFTLYEKTSLTQTAVLVLGPFLSVVPVARFWWMRRQA